MTPQAFVNLQKKFEKGIKERSLSSEEIEAFYYQHVSTARTIELDQKSGRIPIPANLRTYANLSKDCRDCLVVTMNGRLEIWNEEDNKAFMAQVRQINKGIHKKLLGQNLLSDEVEE